MALDFPGEKGKKDSTNKELVFLEFKCVFFFPFILLKELALLLLLLLLYGPYLGFEDLEVVNLPL
jgi:hypothetical protein